MFEDNSSLQRGRIREPLGRHRLALDLESADRTTDPVGSVEQELAAHRALQRGAAKNGDQLLIQRAVKTDDVHSVRNTPITLPRTWTCGE